MFDWRDRSEWKRLIRYYQAGVANTVFGYGLYAGLVAIGLNMYLAQIVSHVIGTAFNYLTYRRFAFADRRASKWRFVLSYGFNYLLSVSFLGLFGQITQSPYLAGFLAVVVVSLINFFVLKKLVFTPTKAA